MKKKNLILVVLFLVSSVVFCEELPLGYKNIRLGQSFEEVRAILEKDSSFGFRGDRDVSLLPTEERVLIETSGSSFFDRCWFQFYENKLYTLILNINVERMDYLLNELEQLLK